MAYYWLIGWSQLRISGHADATHSSPPRGEWSALTSVTHHDDAVNSSPQKPPATYTRVNNFGPHTESIFRGRLIREYIRYVLSDAIADTKPYLGYDSYDTVRHINKTLGIQQLSWPHKAKEDYWRQAQKDWRRKSRMWQSLIKQVYHPDGLRQYVHTPSNIWLHHATVVSSAECKLSINVRHWRTDVYSHSLKIRSQYVKQGRLLHTIQNICSIGYRWTNFHGILGQKNPMTIDWIWRWSVIRAFGDIRLQKTFKILVSFHKCLSGMDGQMMKL